MYYTETMQIANAKDQLKDNSFDLRFGYAVASLLQIVKHIFAFHEFHNNKVVLSSFKKIDQFYYVRVLAHFKNFDLAPLLSNLNGAHLLFQN